MSGAAQAVLVNRHTSTQDLASNADNSTVDSVEREHKTALSGVHLTESSSSGSVTDGSICTTYEPHGDTTNSEISSNKTTSPAKEKFIRNDSVITTMFGGK